MLEAQPISAVRRAEDIAMAGSPPGTLMRRAAGGLAGVVINDLRERGRRIYGARIVLLVGPGDNGGDALMAGARLQARGAQVLALLITGRAHPGGLADLVAAGGRHLDLSRQPGPGPVTTDPTASAEQKSPAYRADGPVGRAWAAAGRALARADTVIDGILGIGGRPGLAGSAERVVAALDPRVPVIAVDLPSGVHPETGTVAGPHVVADRTVTFGCLKPCHLLGPAAQACGRITLVDIGLAADHLGAPLVQRLEPADVAARWPVPRVDDDKYSRGVVGVVAGGGAYSGAATLAVGGAVRSGAGMVRYVGPGSVSADVRLRWPEVVPGVGRVQAWALGPGVDPGRDDDQADVIRDALAGSQPCVVDAGALGVFATVLAEGGVRAPALLTPHAGEAARLLEQVTDRARVDREAVEAAPAEAARELAQVTGATVLLKGAVTVLADPDGGLRTQSEAPAWLATAGAGDVLAGVAGTLLAAGLAPLEAGSLAVWVHGTAATAASGGGPISATDVLDALPTAIAGLLAG